MLIPITISGILHSYILFQNAYKNATDFSNSAISKANLYLDLIINNTQSMANNITFNDNIQKILDKNITLQNITNSFTNRYSNDYLIWQNAKKLLTINFVSYPNLFSNVAVFTKDGQMVMSLYQYRKNTSLANYEWKETLKKSNGVPIWISSHIDRNDLNSHQQHVITLARKIRMTNDYNLNDELGYLVINISEQYLYAMLSRLSFSKDSVFIIVNKKNKIISYSDKTQINQEFRTKRKQVKFNGTSTIFNNKNMILTKVKNERTGWTIIEMVNFGSYFFNSLIYLASSLFITASLLIVFILGSLKISKTISKPFQELQEQMKIVEKGNFVIERTKKSNILEIDELTNSFHKMVSRLHKLIEEVYKSKIKEKELKAAAIQAELSALQQQINPHFLYNTLDSINWLATLGANDLVSNMVTSLSDFFRYCINRGDHLVSIADEVQNIKNYVYMLQIRFGSALSVTINVNPEVNDYMTMKLLLQPIVENAIIHGIEKKNGTGKITISVYKKAASIIFYVQDDGVGMTSETKGQLLSPTTGEKSIGLRNVIQRLTLFFNHKYTINIESHVNEGTIVTISIPCFHTEAELKQILSED